MGTHLVEAVMRYAIRGRGLSGATFGEELGDAATLVVALRHPG